MLDVWAAAVAVADASGERVALTLRWDVVAKSMVVPAVTSPDACSGWWVGRRGLSNACCHLTREHRSAGPGAPGDTNRKTNDGGMLRILRCSGRK